MTHNNVTKLSDTANPCNCPRCGIIGQSIAAINYAETQRWQKSGSFVGSGIGIGTSGIGIGIGSGTYAENGESKSKRADIFGEPGRFVLPTASILIGGFLVAALVLQAPSMGELLTGNASAPQSVFDQRLFWIVEHSAPFVACAILIGAFLRTGQNQALENRLNSEVHPKQLARYNELHYCEACHTLFDNEGHSESANKAGFDRMMGYH